KFIIETIYKQPKMSLPPTTNSPIFNSSFFLGSNDYLTIAVADKRYQKISGTGVFSSLAVAGNLDCGSLTVGGASVDLLSLSGHIIIQESDSYKFYRIYPDCCSTKYHICRDVFIIDCMWRTEWNVKYCGSTKHHVTWNVIITDTFWIDKWNVEHSSSTKHHVTWYSYWIDFVREYHNNKWWSSVNDLYEQHDFIDDLSAERIALIHYCWGCSSGNVNIGTTSPTGTYKVEGASANFTTVYENGVQVATSTDVSYLAGVTAGTATASKALVLDVSKNIATINALTATSVTIGSSTLTNTEAAYFTLITAGTATASKALVLDASKEIYGVDAIGLNSIDPTNNSALLYKGILRKKSNDSTLSDINTNYTNFKTILCEGVIMKKSLMLSNSTTAAVPSSSQFCVQATTSWPDGSYNKAIRCITDNAAPLEFIVKLNAGSNAKSTNATWIGNVSNNDLRFGVNNATRMIFDTNGRLEIETNLPVALLHVSGSNPYTIIRISTNTYNYNVSNNTWTNNRGGPFSFSISAYFSSNIYTVTENIKPIELSLDHYQKLNPVSYNYKNDSTAKLVSPDENLEKVDEDDVESFQYNIDYNQLAVLNGVAIKALIKKIEELEAKQSQLI
ncbi:TPA: hypothetical protein N0F65_007923, partial [Lagenidium giganteum]